MKIAVLTSGILPVPAVQGGAVETLIDFYLDYNNRHQLHDITVYSVWHSAVETHPALQSTVNHYIYIKVDGWWEKVKKKVYQASHGKEYYHYTIEYYLHEALKHIRTQQYDVILIENRPGYALKLKDVTDAQIVYHLHNEKLSTQVARNQEIYNAATSIFTVSDYIKSRVQTINAQDTKTRTVHNGIDLMAFRQTPAKAPIQLNADDFLLVYSGRINREKGIMELIEAMNQLKEHQNIKLLVIGSSFYGNADNKNDFAKSLKEKAEPLKDNIIFTGFIPYSDMPNYLSIADVAVIPSVWDDPFPTTVLEAQAMGLPIITTRRGGIPEEVTEDNAILLDTDEHFVDHLAKAILDLYEHPEKRKAMSEVSIKRSQLFSKEHYAHEFFKALENI